jgi:hypothetical protein
MRFLAEAPSRTKHNKVRGTFPETQTFKGARVWWIAMRRTMLFCLEKERFIKGEILFRRGQR